MTLSGVGSLWLDGVQINPALRYRIDVTQHGVLTRIRGHITIDPHEGALLIARLGPNSDLVLRLEDGRHWPCALKNNYGEVLGRGEIK